MFKTTIKGLLAHKLRLVTTMASIILGVALMAGTLVLTDTVTRTFDDLYADLNRGTDSVVRSDVKVSDGQGGEQRGTVPASLLASVRAVPEVQAADGSIQGYAQFVGHDGKPIGNPGQGPPALGMNWPADGIPTPFQLASGRSPRGPTEVVMDKASADKGGFAVGDTVQLLTKGEPQTMSVVGIVRFGSVDSPLGASIAIFDLATAQRLVGTDGQYDAITVVARPGVSQAQVSDAVRRVVPAGTEAITGDQLTTENQSAVRKNLQFFSTFLLTFAVIAMFVGAFIIYNTFSIIVAQRTRELALLRAMGASRTQVRRAVLTEATVIGVLASGLGIVAGLAMASGLKALLGAVGFAVPAAGTVLTANTVIVSMAIGIVITLASAYFPARKAAKIPPIAALRDAAIDTAAGSRARLVAGGSVAILGVGALSAGLFGGAGITLVAAGAGLLFIGVAILGPVIARPVSGLLGWPISTTRGMSGRLARANAMRNPKRTSSTASALMIGVALVALITILASSTKASVNATIDKSFRSDLVVASGTMGGGGLSPALAADLATKPEIETASGVRIAQVELAGKPDMVVAVDPVKAEQVVDLAVSQGSMAALGADGIAVSKKLATDDHLKVGDTIQAKFATGDRPLQVTTIYDNSDVVGHHLIGLALYDQVVPKPMDFAVYVAFRDGVTPAAGKAAVESATKAYPTATVQDLTEFKEAQAKPIDQMLSLIYALLFLAVIIALLGIANTLALSIHERTRELGLLRAVGMTRAQLRATVRWESVIIALFGTALGLGVGLLFGWAIVRAMASQGIGTFVLPIGQLAFVAVLAALAGIAAALLPARRAARLDVLHAIVAD